MANINKIKISGTTYNIQDENATKTVELTQAQYDALPATAKTSNSLFIITDATGADLSNYYTKSETSGATQISTALNSKANTATTYTKSEVDNAITAEASTKQDTLVSGTNIKTINNESILGEGNIEIQGGGGGKAIEAGRGISITTGETADTVSFDLPISASTNGRGIILTTASTTANYGGIASGYKANAAGNSIVFGYSSSTNVTDSIVVGQYNKIDENGSSRFALGDNNIISTYGQGALGSHLISNAMNEVSCGQYNISRGNHFDFGNSGDTLFSVGNGTENARHNAFEIRQNGDIYIADTNDTSTANYYEKPMIKLQDALGGGSSYTAGTNISITTGETADTINCTLPITVSYPNGVYSFGSNTLSNLYQAFVYGTDNNISILDSSNFTNYYIFGANNVSKGSDLSIIGYRNSVNHSNSSRGGLRNVIVGSNNVSSGSGQWNFSNRIIIGFDNIISGSSHNAAIGNNLICGSYGETALGKYNNSLTEDATKTDYSGNTLFSVGNGSSNTARHNAFEIRQNGDIYCSDGTNDVKLQDTITATAANTTALGGLKLVKLSQSEYDSLETKDNSTLYIING